MASTTRLLTNLGEISHWISRRVPGASILTRPPPRREILNLHTPRGRRNTGRARTRALGGCLLNSPSSHLVSSRLAVVVVDSLWSSCSPPSSWSSSLPSLRGKSSQARDAKLSTHDTERNVRNASLDSLVRLVERRSLEKVMALLGGRGSPFLRQHFTTGSRPPSTSRRSQ